ncbi:MAG: hypothetical protein ACRDLL_12600, partial [Solirubrobacterales bacterium]
ATPDLRSRDLLLTNASGNPDSLGAVAVCDDDLPEGTTFGSQLVRIRAEGIDSDLLWALLQTPQARSFLLKNAVNHSNRYSIAVADLARLPLPQAPTASQVPLARLARVLRLLLALSRQQLGLLQTAIQAHLSHAFGGAKFLPAEPAGMRSSDHGDMPSAMQPLLKVASPAQLKAWELAVSQGATFRVADLSASARDRSSIQHTISILEQLGVLVREPEGAIERWRVPDSDEEPGI